MKKYAIVLGGTGNLSFALGVVLLGLKKYNSTLLIDTDIYVYYQNMSENDKFALNNIVPCQFLPYNFPSMEGMSAHILRDYGEMTFARYECFKYLKNYERVCWLDADILIQGDISEMFTEMCGDIAFRREYYDQRIRINFKNNIDGYDMNAAHYNAGIMVLSNKLLPLADELYDWCYKKTCEISSLLYFPDQGILLLMCQHFKLSIYALSEKYNCEARRNSFVCRKAAIIHAVGHRKFWKYYYFHQWYKFYLGWRKIGGSSCENHFQLYEKTGLNKFSFLQVAPLVTKYPRKFITYLFKKILGPFNLDTPCD